VTKIPANIKTIPYSREIGKFRFGFLRHTVIGVSQRANTIETTIRA